MSLTAATLTTCGILPLSAADMSIALLFPFLSGTVKMYTLLGPFALVGGGVTVVVGGIPATEIATRGPGVAPLEVPLGVGAPVDDGPDWPVVPGCDPVDAGLDGVAAGA